VFCDGVALLDDITIADVAEYDAVLLREFLAEFEGDVGRIC
jgi:hypothetical protein